MKIRGWDYDGMQIHEKKSKGSKFPSMRILVYMCDMKYCENKASIVMDQVYFVLNSQTEKPFPKI